MFALPFFIIGILYIFTRLFIEDAGNAAYKYDTEKRSILMRRYLEELKIKKDLLIQIKYTIICGDCYNQICNRYHEDFEFILGENWRDILGIPQKHVDLSDKDLKKLSKNKLRDFPEHTYMVKQLILADKGEWLAREAVFGYHTFDYDNAEIYMRLVHCVEKRLNIANGTDLTFLLIRSPSYGLSGLDNSDKAKAWRNETDIKKKIVGGKFKVWEDVWEEIDSCDDICWDWRDTILTMEDK